MERGLVKRRVVVRRKAGGSRPAFLRNAAIAGLMLFSCWMTTQAAEFNLDAPLPRLRRLQPCVSCGAALAVTDWRVGESVRCALCEHVESRLPDDRLLTLLYQACPVCSAQLDASGCRAGQLVRCGACRHEQPVLPEVADFANRPERAAERAAFARELLAYSANASARRAQARSAAPVPEISGSPDDSAASASVSAVAAISDSDSAAPVPGISGSPDDSDATASASAVASDSAGLFGAVEASDRLRESPSADGVGAAGAGVPVLLPAPPDFAPAARREAGGVRIAPAVTAADFARPAREIAAAASSAAADGAVFDSAFGAPRVIDGVPAASAAGIAFSPVAFVNGRPILRRDLDEAMAERLRRARAELGQAADAPEGRAWLAQHAGEARQSALDGLIDRAVALQAAERDGIRPSEEGVLAMREALLANRYPGDAGQRARDDATMAVLLARFIRKAEMSVTPEAVRRAYAERRGELTEPLRWAVKPLVIYRDRSGRADPRPAEAIADEAGARLERREPFDEVCARYSETPPEAAAAAPALLQPGAYDDAVRKALADAPAGRVAGPLAADHWIMFVKLAERREAGVRPFAEVSEGLRRDLAEAAGMKAFGEWLARERAQAAIRLPAA